MLTRNKSNNQKKKLISATRISNFIKNDCIVDYLDCINKNHHYLNEDLSLLAKSSKKRSNSFDSNSFDLNSFDSDNKQNKKIKSSFDYIVESGYYFENDIISQIENNMKSNGEFNKLIKITESDVDLNFALTVKTLIESKYNIILGSVLINSKNNTWGYPDIIVKGIWIQNYINKELDNISSNKYYIIDIKSSTINLINGGADMSSKLLYDVYKSQIYIYTQALNNIFEEYNILNNVDCAFILGKKYQYTLNKLTINKKPFDILGQVNFTNEKLYKTDYEQIITNGLEWHKDLNLNWENFKLNPINNDNLYPNMKNPYDKNYKKIKKTIAIKNKEITLLWNCGVKNRQLAWNQGIKRYDDPKLNCKILGFENTSKENILDPMLKILHSDKIVLLNKNNNFMNWQLLGQFEFYVDFETFNTESIYDENSNMDMNMDNSNNLYSSTQQIYMIGIGFYNKNNKNNFEHKSFIIDYKQSKRLQEYIGKDKICQPEVYVLCKNELDLIIQFINYINSFKPFNMSKTDFDLKTRLIHWSCAEPVIFNKKLKEYYVDILPENNFKWYDLLKIFKYEKFPIIIKECFSFGLKDIVRKLNEYNCINIKWSELDDGLLSSFIARDIYIGNKVLDYNENMVNIVEYNYIDCKTMLEILNWMRNYII